MSASSRVIDAEGGVLVLLSLHHRSYLDQYDVLNVLWHRGYGISFGGLMYCTTSEVDWSRCESSWYPQKFAKSEDGLVLHGIETGQKQKSDGVVIPERPLPAITAIFLAGTRFLSLLLSRTCVNSFLAVTIMILMRQLCVKL